MKTLRRAMLMVAVAAGSLIVAGCQAKSEQAQKSSLQPAADGVMCSKCETTFVKVPIDAGKQRIVGYTSRKVHTCPDCRNAAENFFATGKLEHSCKTCGSAMEICKAH